MDNHASDRGPLSEMQVEHVCYISKLHKMRKHADFQFSTHVMSGVLVCLYTKSAWFC